MKRRIVPHPVSSCLIVADADGNMTLHSIGSKPDCIKAISDFEHGDADTFLVMEVSACFIADGGDDEGLQL